MEILDRPNKITIPPMTTTNRVIAWAIRDMTPLTKSGYRGNLGSLIVDRKPEHTK